MAEESVLGLTVTADSSVVGGKAFSLSKMLNAGYNVPDGFVILSQTERKTSQKQKKLILNHFDKLGTDFVAVRSSSVSEDSLDTTWAGQFDTFLNTTKDTLLKNIERCYKSAEGIRARAYAAHNNIDIGKVAVIVQKMIPSKVSGVAFSVDPISQNANLVVIEAGLGLGEAIVSGEISPDRYEVSKKGFKILSKHIANQTKQLIKNPLNNNTWQPVANGRDQKLSDKQIVKLCKTVSDLESFFGYPVDVEWAISSNVIYILQCRPITTLSK